ncbi:MAG: hypothetical protein ACRDKE_06370 [Solirubrobacterales bacterium]
MTTGRKSLRLLNVSEIAELTGLSPATVSARLNAAGIQPTELRGRVKLFDMPPLIQLRLAGEGGLDAQQEKARYDKARADIAELDLAKRRHELIEVDDSKAVALAVAATIATGFLAFPTKVAPLITGEMPIAEREAVLRTHVHELLAELAALGAEIEPDARSAQPHRFDSSDGDEASAAPDAERVVGRRARSKSRRKSGAGEVED